MCTDFVHSAFTWGAQLCLFFSIFCVFHEWLDFSKHSGMEVFGKTFGIIDSWRLNRQLPLNPRPFIFDSANQMSLSLISVSLSQIFWRSSLECHPSVTSTLTTMDAFYFSHLCHVQFPRQDDHHTSAKISQHRDLNPQPSNLSLLAGALPSLLGFASLYLITFTTFRSQRPLKSLL